MPEPTTSLLGRTIGRRYRIEELVGSGAMGDVYRARHTELGTDVAIKIMRPDMAEGSKFKERFYREAKAASRLEHPNSVRVLDFGQEDDGLVYLAMEFLRGRDLLAIIRDEWPLTDERVVDILAQTLAALSLAHQHGIVHRDLKPENIMVVPDEDDDRRDCVKVCDFGIAKLTEPRAFKSKEDVTTALTVGHAIVGTPEYMSPEQARGDSLDARSDLYSVGVILYRLLAGQLPFDAENVIGLAVKHITEEPVPPSQIRAQVHPRLEEICLRALRKDPVHRHANAKEMRAELRGALGTGSTGASPARFDSGRYPAAQQPPPRETAPSSPAFFEQPPGSNVASGRPLNAVESAPTLRDGFLPKHKAEPTTSDSDESAHLRTQPGGSSKQRIIFGVVLGVLAFIGVGLIIDTVNKRRSAENVANGLVSSPVGNALASGSPAPPTSIVALPDDTQTPPPTTTTTSPTHGAVAVRPGVRPPHAPSASHAPAASVKPPASVAPPAPPPPAPTAAPPPPSAEYKPKNASVLRLPLVAIRVQPGPIDKKMSDLMPQLNECYRDALFHVGAPVGGNAEIQMSIDREGHVVPVVIAGQLPQFQRCASRLLGQFSVPASTVDPQGGTASQALKLTP